MAGGTKTGFLVLALAALILAAVLTWNLLSSESQTVEYVMPAQAGVSQAQPFAPAQAEAVGTGTINVVPSGGR
jgi:hypothetical protein